MLQTINSFIFLYAFVQNKKKNTKRNGQKQTCKDFVFVVSFLS